MSAEARKKTIYYGVCGEGFGHLSRAEFLVPRLEAAGYEVELFASGRAFAALGKLFPGRAVHEVRGLRFSYDGNRLDALRSGWQHAAILWWWPIQKTRSLVRLWREKPLAVITDYELVLARTARGAKVPRVAFDHQQIASECRLEVPKSQRLRLFAMRWFNHMVNASPDLRVITSFFHPPLIERSGGPKRLLVGPTLRREVFEREPSAGSHVVVYQTADTAAWLEKILPALPGEKRVYGASVAPAEGIVPRKHSTGGFLDDLASCRFAVVNGGHMAISEALHYGKPVACLPMRGQVEQEINADQLRKLGFGLAYRPGPGEAPDFSEFLAREDEFRRNIAERRLPPGNDQAAEAILAFLREAEARRDAADAR